MERGTYNYTFEELIQFVSETATTDDEVVATVTYLINSGQVRLGGSLSGATVDTRPSLQAFLDWVRSQPDPVQKFKLSA